MRKKQEEIENQRLAAARAEEEAKERAAALRLDRDKLKKLQSKSRNLFRKLLRHAASVKLGDPKDPNSEYGIFSLDDVELICTQV